MEESIKKLKRLDELYLTGTPEISDTEYDIFKESIRQQYPEHEYFKTVGAEISNKSNEVKLDFVLGSLAKMKPDGTMEQWLHKTADTKYVASLKADGVSFEVIYKNGNVVAANTRGNGYVGQNILDKAQVFCKKNILTKDSIRLRGEILFRNDDYKAFGFKNGRNGCAGLINRLDSSKKFNINDYKYLKPVFYEIIEMDGLSEMDQTEQLRFIKHLGLDTVPFVGIDTFTTEKDLVEIYNDMKISVDFESDGLVIVGNTTVRENVSIPSNKVCFKVNENSVRVRVLSVEWSTTRTGLIVPVINITPTKIAGVTISNVTAFNAKFILDHKIGAGAEIGIIRSGEVIPYITDIFKPAEDVTYPKWCPSCNTKLEFSRTRVNLVCPNEICSAKTIKTISHFFTTLGCKNFSEKTFINLGRNSIVGVLEMSKKDISKRPGFGEKSGNIIKDEIDRVFENCTEELFIQALGINGIGKTVSEELVSRYTFDEIITGKINYDELIQIPGIGIVLAESVLKIKDFNSFYELLKKEHGLKFKKSESTDSDSPLFGKHIAFTGAGPMKRKDFEAVLKSKGAKIGSVSAKTDILVINDLDSSSGKAKNARKLGTKMMLYEDFIEKYI